MHVDSKVYIPNISILVNQNYFTDKVYLFGKLNNDEWLFHHVDYDFESAGHFPLHKYSDNGRATIKPKKVKSLIKYLNVDVYVLVTVLKIIT